MTSANEQVKVAIRWPGDDTPDEPGVTYVNASDVQISARVLRNFGAYRQNNIITTDLVTALRWVEAKLIDVTYDETHSQLFAAANAAVAAQPDGGAADGDPKVTGESEPRPRARASRRRDDAVHARHNAGNTEPVEGADTGRSGDSTG